jgi:hypothetical protein
LDLKPYKLKWYCKKCYTEGMEEEYPVLITVNLLELNDYDHCSRCGKLFDYLDLRSHDLKWYCEKCYKEITTVDVIAISRAEE